MTFDVICFTGFVVGYLHSCCWSIWFGWGVYAILVVWLIWVVLWVFWIAGVGGFQVAFAFWFFVRRGWLGVVVCLLGGFGGYFGV